MKYVDTVMQSSLNPDKRLMAFFRVENKISQMKKDHASTASLHKNGNHNEFAPAPLPAKFVIDSDDSAANPVQRKNPK